MAMTEVKKEKELYVWLPPDYEAGIDIIKWVLNNFPKDETKIIVTSIIPTSAANNSAILNRWREMNNKTLDEHMAQCAMQKFKAEKLIHESGDVEEGILELIDLMAIKNLVVGFSPDSQVAERVRDKVNPSSKIWFIPTGNLLFTRYPRLDLTEATCQEVREGETVYVFLPWNHYDKGRHVLSWTLSYFPKDQTKLIATFIIPLSKKDALLDQWRETDNKTIDEHMAQCEIQKFKAEKLIHESDDLAEGILELIDLMAIKNLVMGSSPKSQLTELVREKANPSCKIWFIRTGNLLFTRYPRLDLTEATSAEVEMEVLRREKLHFKEIEEIQRRENDKNEALKREIDTLKLEKNLLINERIDNLIHIKELVKYRQQLGKLASDIQIDLGKQEERMGELISDLKEGHMVQSCQFSLGELEEATQNFSDSLKIGEGGFGCVYRGSLRKTTVAIKKLNAESLQGLSEFQQEVAILSRVRHPNIVNLMGSCPEISALVYEFLPNGSLEDYLANNYSALTWQARMRIISEICLGLAFLHSHKPELVIHGDLKPSNILLDANLICKLADFGISKMIKQPNTNLTAVYHTSHPGGTIGYIDPELVSLGELTPKSDVYAFGIIILRLLTGKPAVNIASEVRKVMQTGRLSSIVDKSGGKWPDDLAKKLAELAVICAEMSRAKRPDISQVWATIEPLVNVASQLKG